MTVETFALVAVEVDEAKNDDWTVVVFFVGNVGVAAVTRTFALRVPIVPLASITALGLGIPKANRVIFATPSPPRTENGVLVAGTDSSTTGFSKVVVVVGLRERFNATTAVITINA